MPGSPQSVQDVLTSGVSPASRLKFDEDHRFLREVIYVGLKDLNNGFDSPLIGHFSPRDFLIVIDRCESLHVRIIGIEVFTTEVEPPWKAGLLEIEISPEDGYEWARRLVGRYQGKAAISVCATFGIP